MYGVPFADAPIPPATGLRKGLVFARRLLRRLLRPMLQQLDAELMALAARQDQCDREARAVAALGWDHVALARRLAVIEDQLDALLSREAADLQAAQADGEVRPSIPYPGRDGQGPDDLRHAAPQVKVS